MLQQAQNRYLESQVLTATPQKLRLMLIEAAIAAARQSLETWDDPQISGQSLGRCRNMVSELLSSIRCDDSELSRRVAGVYVFLFQMLTEAQLRRQQEGVEGTIRVLEVERETWRMVCDKVPERPLGAPQALEITSQAAPVSSPPRASGNLDDPPGSGLLLDA